MLFLDALIRQHIPEWNTKSRLHIACIATTNPVYLVFSENSSYPELVIRVAESEDIIKTHNITQQLFKKVGNLVPESITTFNFENRNFTVQKGVNGMPWFQLAQSISTAAQWNALRGRAITALNQLHKGTMAIESWKTECVPGQELRDCFKKCIAAGTELPQQVKTQVEIMGKELDSLGTISAFPQHGDYCLNNLIIDVDAIHIIDFEDFGMTSMPLHDEFALALSMHSKSIATSLRHELNACTEVNLFNINSTALPGFFMHHLLLRLGEWSKPIQRQKYREWLLSILDNFLLEPHSFFDKLVLKKH